MVIVVVLPVTVVAPTALITKRIAEELSVVGDDAAGDARLRPGLAGGVADFEQRVADRRVGVVDRDRRDVHVVAGLIDDCHAGKRLGKCDAGGVDWCGCGAVVGDRDGGDYNIAGIDLAVAVIVDEQSSGLIDGEGFVGHETHPLSAAIATTPWR